MNTSSIPVNLREAIKKPDSLPALPSIAQKLQALDASSEAGTHDSGREAPGISPEHATLFAANLG